MHIREMMLCRHTMLVLAAVVVTGVTAVPSAGAKVSVKRQLTPTGAAPSAQGQVVVVVAKHSKGKMQIVAHHLRPNATFNVVVNSVRIGTLTTNGGGNGRARFSTTPRGHDQLLGVDPQGQLVEVQDDDSGEDALETEMPPDTADAGDVQCCRTHEGEAECDETTPDKCTPDQGVNMGAGSCMPNPCPSTSPSPDEIACCVPDHDENGPECETATVDECMASQGVNLGAVACDPNPCAPTSPSTPEIACCVPDDEGVECEEQTADECTALGGTNLGTGTCDPTPCASTPPAGDIQCCRTHEGETECDEATPDECTADGGTNLGAGTCDPNPCTP
ncbi:MAG: hypothetical protein HY271_17665 [Deltaproteobacteria bacterium]|nr:hypothetical protein [Deltaproteobacteria bacterium]